MSSQMRLRLEQLKVEELRRQYPGLQLRPVNNGELRLAGALEFSAEAPGYAKLGDRYDLEIVVPEGFPKEPPLVREVGGRIPRTFHTNPDGTLCLGSPARLRLSLMRTPNLPGFVNHCVVPYLYGFTHLQRHGELPFGELAHGAAGLRQEFAGFFGVSSGRIAVELVGLAGMRKRVANKLPCPCGSRRRLGRCHHLAVNRLRTELGRKWLRRHSGQI